MICLCLPQPLRFGKGSLRRQGGACQANEDMEKTRAQDKEGLAGALRTARKLSRQGRHNAGRQGRLQDIASLEAKDNTKGPCPSHIWRGLYLYSPGVYDAKNGSDAVRFCTVSEGATGPFSPIRQAIRKDNSLSWCRRCDRQGEYDLLRHYQPNSGSRRDVFERKIH